MQLAKLKERVKQQQLPNHIAIIMDGNGRWAKKHKFKRIMGHKKGVETVRKIVEISGEIGLKYLTLYAFSTENWRRSKTEVDYLLKLIIETLDKEIDELVEKNVVIKFIGTDKGLSHSYRDKIESTSQKSWHNDGLHLNVAMNYGGRRELVEAVQKIGRKVKSGEIEAADIDEKLISAHLYTANMPEPDLLIRTSGEYRLSNFLIWQSAYAELWFTPVLWPDFTQKHFLEAIWDFQNRERRFGAR
jgi:undecaprenyl diphosphate synthase